MAGASRELFPTDRGLVARMVVAAVATPLVVLAALAAVVAVAPTRLVIGVGIAIAIGLYLVWQERAATVRPTSSRRPPRPSCTPRSSACA